MNLNLALKQVKLPVTLTVFSLSFLVLIKPPLGGDFGWHLMTGQHIVTHLNIPQTDLFSHSAPNYPYAYHSWGAEVIIYLIYSNFSLIGVSVFFAGLCAIGFSLLSRLPLPNYHPLLLLVFPTLAIPIDMLTGVSIRTQSFTLLFLALAFLLLSKSIKPISSKLTYISWLESTHLWSLPFLFFFWVNLHGGFILGLGLYLLILFTHLATHIHKTNLPSFQKLYRFHLITFTLCALATFINPYTYRIHQLTLTMVTNRAAAATNLDWIPFYLRSEGHVPTIFLIFAISFLLTTMLAKPSPFHRLLLTTTYLLTFASPRFILIFITILLPLLPTTLTSLYRRLNPRLRLFTTFVFLSLSLVLLSKALIINFKNLYCAQTPVCFAQIGKRDRVTYPYGAVQFIRQHSLKPNLLNNFNWGGYLIWQLPDIKTFADGKMDNYIINGQPFITIYQNLVLAEPGWQDLLEHYDINTVLLSPNEPLVHQLQQSPDWQIIFQDEFSILLEKTAQE